MSRLRPASTTSSYTTSASTRPDCGRASAMFSILTTSAGRFCFGSAPAVRPVNGNTGGTVVVVVAGAAVDPAVVFFPPPEEQAAAIRASAAATAATETQRLDITAPSGP